MTNADQRNWRQIRIFAVPVLAGCRATHLFLVDQREVPHSGHHTRMIIRKELEESGKTDAKAPAKQFPTQANSSQVGLGQGQG